MRIGVYGGSFDPVHIGHLLLAEAARVEQALDRVDFVPLGTPPHLKNVRTSSELRYQMLMAATATYPEFAVERFEIDSPRISFTVDTIRYYRERYPEDDIFLILSSETLNDLPNWRFPDVICELASLIVARRAGYPEPDFNALLRFTSVERVREFREQTIEMPQIEISSSAVRSCVAGGKSIRFQTLDGVVKIIQDNNLYKK